MININKMKYQHAINDLVDTNTTFEDLNKNDQWELTALYLRDVCKRSYADIDLEMDKIVLALVMHPKDPEILLAHIKLELILAYQYDIENDIDKLREANILFNDFEYVSSRTRLDKFANKGII